MYSEPVFIEKTDRRLTWLKENAFASKGKGWFAAGYGAFRRLTRENRVIVPMLTSQERFGNFGTQFKEDEALTSFEQWLVYLDYRIAKGDGNGKSQAKSQMDIAIAAVNQILPEGVSFNSVSEDGKIMFDVTGKKVATLNLSDGYRSVLALLGDLVWRMIDHFPESENPLSEEGIVLIDELDIHLHPVWQRAIPVSLRRLFPNIQFIVATHSPIIAAGAGADALSYRFLFEEGKMTAKLVNDVAFMHVDKILQSPAFGLVSPYSVETQAQLDRYLQLSKKKNRSKEEENELKTVVNTLHLQEWLKINTQSDGKKI